METKKTYGEKLNDPRWQRKRLEIFERDQWRCRLCNDEKSTLHVHHDKYESGKEPWEVDDSFLRTLCECCHSITEIVKGTLFPNPCSILKIKEHCNDRFVIVKFSDQSDVCIFYAQQNTYDWVCSGRFARKDLNAIGGFLLDGSNILDKKLS